VFCIEATIGLARLLAFKQVHGLFVGLWVLGFDGPWANGCV